MGHICLFSIQSQSFILWDKYPSSLSLSPFPLSLVPFFSLILYLLALSLISCPLSLWDK